MEQITIYNFKFNMIQKILLRNSIGFKSLWQPSFMHYTKRKFDYSQNPEIEELRNPRDLLQHMSRWRDSEIPVKEFKYYCDQIPRIYFPQSAQITVLNVFKMIKRQNIEELSFSTVASLCEALSTMEMHIGIDQRIGASIEKKLQNTLKDGNQQNNIRIQDLVKVFQFSTVYRKGKMNSVVCNTICERMEEVKYREIRAMMGSLIKVKFPIQKQKQIFDNMIRFLNQNFENLDIGFKIQLFKNIHYFNQMIWNSGNILRKLEQNILDNFQLLEYSQIKNLLRLKSKDNKFAPLIFKKTMELINQNGECSLQTQQVLMLFTGIAEIMPVAKLITSKTMDQKFMKFLEVNCLESERVWSFLIHKRFLKEKHIKLIFEICKSNNVNQKSPSYIYELTKRNLYFDSYEQYLSDITAIPSQKLRVTNNFLMNSLILKKLTTRFPQDEAVKAHFNKLKEKIQKFNGNAIDYLNSIENRDLLKDFHRKFSNLYMKKFQEQNLIWEENDTTTKNESEGQQISEEENEKKKLKGMKASLQIYLIRSGDLRRIQRLMRIMPEQNKFNLFYVALNKFSNSAKNIYSFQIDTVLKILSMMPINKSSIQIFSKILINWENHELMRPDEVELLLDIFLKIVESENQILENNQMWNLCSYILKSPNRNIEKSKKYYQILTKLRERELASKNNKVIITFLHQLHKNGILEEQDLTKNAKFSVKNQKILSYIDFLKGENSQQIIPSSQNISAIVRFSSQTYIDNNSEKIGQIIEGLNIYQLEEVLMNFRGNIFHNPPVLQMFNKAIKAYGNQLKKYKAFRKFDIILSKLKQFGFNPNPNFLNNAAIHYSSNISEIPTSSIIDFINVLLSTYGEVESQEFIQSAKAEGLRRLKNEEGDIRDLLAMSYGLCMLDKTTFDFFQKVAQNVNWLSQSNTSLKKMFTISNFVGVSSKKFEQVLEITLNVVLKRKLKLREVDIKYLAHLYPSLSQKLKKVETTTESKNEKVNRLYEIIKKTCQQSSIKHQFIEKCGSKVLKMGDKHLFLSSMIYSPARAQTLKKFVQVVFDLQGCHQNDIVIYFCRKRSNFAFANIFDNELECFESAKETFLKVIQEQTGKKNEISFNENEEEDDDEDEEQGKK